MSSLKKNLSLLKNRFRNLRKNLSNHPNRLKNRLPNANLQRKVRQPILTSVAAGLGLPAVRKAAKARAAKAAVRARALKAKVPAAGWATARVAAADPATTAAVRAAKAAERGRAAAAVIRYSRPA